MTTAEASLEQLLERTSLGDRTAFEALYNRTSAKLFGICLRILSERSEAEEVLQEAYIKIWNNADRYAASRARPITWMAAIARNQAIDRLRAKKPPSADIETAIAIEDPNPSPEQIQSDRDDAQRLERCLQGLDPKHAGAIRAAFFGGATYQEIAWRENMPLATMKSQIRRSLLKLRACLED